MLFEGLSDAALVEGKRRVGVSERTRNGLVPGAGVARSIN